MGGILVLTLLAPPPARSENDAATKAREGEIHHWIEYYQKNREPAVAPSVTPRNGAEKVAPKESGPVDPPKRP